MNRRNLLLIILIYLFLNLLCEGYVLAQYEAWIARYNSSGNGFDFANAIALDENGNVYVTGAIYGNGIYADYITIKYDNNGREQWASSYNGSGNRSDFATDIAIDDEGNIYVTGYSTGIGGNDDYDYATIKYDNNGNELWISRYKSPDNLTDGANAIIVDNLGNVYVTGGSYSVVSSVDYVTIKYNSDGNELWVSHYNGPGNGGDEAVAIDLDELGNVYVTGESYSAETSYDYATIKYNKEGNEQWVSRYDSFGLYHSDITTDMAIDTSGNIYVTGYSFSEETTHDYATIKYDSDGNELWVSRYDGAGYWYDKAYAITIDDLGNVYVTGYSHEDENNVDYGDYTTIKYNNNGNELWVSHYNGLGNDYDMAYDIVVDNFGNVYVTGESYTYDTFFDYATIKYDNNGNELWISRYDGPVNGYDVATAIAVDTSGNVYVTGSSYGGVSQFDCATIKYVPIVDIELASISSTILRPGDVVAYNVTLTNNGQEPATVEVRTWVILSSGEVIDPLDGPQTITINSVQSVSRDMKKTVPLELEPGHCILNAVVEDTEGKLIDQESVIYTIIPLSTPDNKEY